jgi:hypothetical protein
MNSPAGVPRGVRGAGRGWEWRRLPLVDRMRLVDLQPRWGTDGTRRWVSFLCPHCRTQRLSVPVGAGGWQASGETFDTLTLTPSVDVGGFGHWHGFITNGEIQ